jgi:mannose-6-phosphate isomerase
MLPPLKFRPILKERIWGGRNLETLYHKPLPPDRPIGESWEISDRPGDASVIDGGPHSGKDLRWLMEEHGAELLGHKPRPGQRFPVLVKILDARETLSLQVHPPPAIAAQLGGEPKSEFWYVAQAAPGSHLFAGLRSRVTRAEFETRIQDGTVADCFHRLPVRAGDALWLPSGRVHAIGAGNVIYEIQQNSDTTYRVFDWNRNGLDGRPREIHAAQSLASIDFNDFEPDLIRNPARPHPPAEHRLLIAGPEFKITLHRLPAGERFEFLAEGCRVAGILQGRLTISAAGAKRGCGAGEFCLLPASVASAVGVAETPVEFLEVILTAPGGSEPSSAR